MRFTVITILFFLAFVAGAQNNNVIDINYKKLDIPPLTSDCFFFSSDNILWFSTARGLTSFDGTEIHSYYPDTSAINNYYFSGITAITEDSSKNLWIATRKIALIYFNTSSKKCVTVNLGNEKSELHLDNITRLFLDKNGFLWVSTIGCGFYIYNTRSGSVEHYNFSDKPIDCNKFPSGLSGIGPKNCMSPHLKDPDKMWLGSVEGIFLFDRKTKQIVKEFEFRGTAKIHDQTKLNISYLEMIDDSTLCVGTEYYGMGLYDINNNSLKMFSPHPSRQNKIYPYPTIDDSDYLQVAYVSKKSVDEYWVSNVDSLPIIFNSRTKNYSHLRNAEFFKKTQDFFFSITAMDRKGDMFFKKNKDLYVISNDFSLFDVKTTPPIYGITDDVDIGLSDIIWDEESHSYFTAYRYLDQIYQLDSNLNLIKIRSTSFPPETIYRNIKLIKDTEKRIWALRTEYFLTKEYSTINSISVLLYGAENFISPQQLSTSLRALQKVEDITVDKKGNILFSKLNGDIFILNSGTLKLDSVKFPQRSSKIKGVNCRLHYDPNLDCVYTSNGSTVVQYDLRTKVMRYFKPEDLTPPDRNEWSFCSFDTQGNIWVIRRLMPENELRLYDPRTFRLIKTVEFRNYKGERMNIASFEWGPEHNILCSTSDGLLIYNYKNGMFKLIDKDNGLLSELQDRKIRFVNNKVFWTHGWKIQYASFTKLFSLTYDRIPSINRIKIFGNKVSYIEPLNKTVELDHKRNNIGISFSSIEYLFPERIQYAFRLSAIDIEWRITDHKSREIIYSNLRPGKYVFELKAQMLGGNWEQDPLKLYITITPPFWQTWWFRTIAAISIIGILYWLFRRRIASVRKKEQLNAKHEKELLELEAKALRAQMNPHFVFNCMNSIKALIHNDEKLRAIEYLTTFSKLIRTLFQNSDKRQISLFDEIETCKLYTQLEAMRLNGKLKYSFEIDPNLDLKSVMVPALIIQPFIENAIWHGIVPKDEGTIKVTVKGNASAIICEVDDNGIGREMSKLNKPVTPVIHESKGVHLSQVRLDLEKLLNETQATIETFDKYDNDKSTGTKVVLNFNLN